MSIVVLKQDGAKGKKLNLEVTVAATGSPGSCVLGLWREDTHEIVGHSDVCAGEFSTVFELEHSLSQDLPVKWCLYSVKADGTVDETCFVGAYTTGLQAMFKGKSVTEAVGTASLTVNTKVKADPNQKKKEKKVAPESEGPVLTKAQIKKNKAALKEGGKKGQDLAGMATFGVSFFCADMQEPEGNMELLELCMQGANAVVDPEGEDRKGGAGDLGKVFFSNGDDMLSMICHVPKELHEHTTAKEFFGHICDAVGAKLVGEQTEFMLRAQVPKDVDAGRFPIKLKDEALSAGFAFLRSKSLILEDDDSGDDINFADDCGIDLNAGATGSDY